MSWPVLVRPFLLLGEVSSGTSGTHFDLHIVAVLLVSLGTLIAAFVLVIAPLSDVRDNLVETGWISSNSWLGRQFLRRKEHQLKSLLKIMGFTEEHRSNIEEAQRRSRSAQEAKAKDTNGLIRKLLGAMQQCLVEEENRKEFRETTGIYYVDVMGASSVMPPEDWDFATILAKWLHILRSEKRIEHFDVILTPKNGNPTLAHHAATRYSPAAPPTIFVWKSFEDRSRVSRPVVKEPHYLDFEGLQACERKHEDKSRKLRVLAVDDNFTSGSTLTGAIEQFNNLLLNGGHPFHPIVSAVTLFAVNSEEAERNFQRLSDNFKVHTLVSVGPEELARLKNEKLTKLMKSLPTFQKSFACEVARRLQ
jgi:hypothetical protein